MGAVKSFQGGNHINKKVPAQFAQSPLPIESFLHIQTWHTRHPTSGQAYALEFNVSFAGVSGIAFNVPTLCQHRWNTSVNWSQPTADVDLLGMCGRRQDLEATLQAMGLDHRKLPQKRDRSVGQVCRASKADIRALDRSLCSLPFALMPLES